MNMAAARILLIGHGEIGHAIEFLLRPRYPLVIWQRHPRAGAAPVDLAREAAGADVIFLCIPTPPHAELLDRLAPHLRPDTVVVTLAKGLDDRARSGGEILAARLPAGVHAAALYGPMIAEEICTGRPAFALAAAPQPATASGLCVLFAGSALALEPADDLVGLSWCAVLKNVYAMLFGMADELALGDNVRGWLAVSATAEMARIVRALGGTPGAAQTLAGLGDLITTATSGHSHHHELGRRLARGTVGDLRGEGAHALEVLRAIPRFDVRSCTLYRAIDASLREPTRAAERLRALVRAGP